MTNRRPIYLPMWDPTACTLKPPDTCASPRFDNVMNDKNGGRPTPHDEWMADLDAKISKVRHLTGQTRCRVCAQMDLCRAVARWLQRRAAGESLPSLEAMHDQLFSKMGTTSPSALRRHVTRCLKLDHRTGRAL